MNVKNVKRLRDAVAVSTEFDMAHHETCLIGHAARLDEFPNYRGLEDGNSDILLRFIDVDDKVVGKYIWSRTGADQKEVIAMLDHLIETGEVVWA